MFVYLDVFILGQCIIRCGSITEQMKEYHASNMNFGLT